MEENKKNILTDKTDSVLVAARKYLSLNKEPLNVRKKLSIRLSDHSYLPRVDDLRSDWVSWAAVPAFRQYRRARGWKRIPSFCSIGTGSGLDVLSAIEVLGAGRVGLTDVHEDVVNTAVDNIKNNKKDDYSLEIEAGYGDLLSPLEKYSPRYDVIYENLPNLPLQKQKKVSEDRTSSVYLAPRKERIPEDVHKQMLDLHYLALKQSRKFLTDSGSVLSVMGGRIPLEKFIELGASAGYNSSVLLYKWKIQADAGEVVRDYASRQEKGYGPFYFYRAETLERYFKLVKQRITGNAAFKAENDLLPERLDAVTAFNELKNGITIGHTVVVLESGLN